MNNTGSASIPFQANTESQSISPKLRSTTPETSANEYAELKQIIKTMGLLEKQPAYYTYKILLTMGMLALSVTFFLMVNNFWLQLLNAIFLAVTSAQIGFLGHDGGHRQIFRSTAKNNILTLLLGNLLIGMSNRWWLDKHNQHHSHPNQIDLDPDIDIAVLAFTDEEARLKRGIERFIVKRQIFFFFPLLSLVGLDLHVKSILFLFKEKGQYRLTEGLLLAGHYVLYIGLLLSRLNIWQAIIFMLVHQLFFGLFLGSAFAPNHKGMPILDKDSPMNFLRRQVLTSRNVKGGLFNDFWYGGLNYQVEHHLFPSMPRNRLREAQQVVKDFCQARAIPYHETSIVQSYREILQFLHEVSAPLRTQRAA